MIKKRILWFGEATYLSTGYSVYGKELLTYLYNTGKYEIAEFASYGGAGDPRRFESPWLYYANLPSTPQEKEIYGINTQNQWGLWRMDEVFLDFKPHYVISIRDWWADEFISRSPYRKLFKWFYMPTVDSAPQKDQWLSTFIDADAILTYSEFGKDTLLKETNNKVKFFDIASPAANYEYFKPVLDKKAHKESFGLDSKSIIIGTVMRNQKRKFYPELIKAFKLLLEKSDKPEDIYLYLHTAYPDVGWDIPKLVRESGIGHKILFTYVCSGCDHIFPSFFNDAFQICPRCKKSPARLPNSDKGVETADLARVMQCFDLYVQYSSCLTGNQEILTYDGWKEIKDVKEGELVYTHKHNWKEVKQKFENPNNNNVYKINVWGNKDTLEITGNHPVYAYTKEILGKPNYKRHTKELFTRLNHKNQIPSPEFIEVDKLSKNDLICYPINDTVSWLNKLDISLYASPEDTWIPNRAEIKVKHGDVYPTVIDIDNEFCRFIGLFAADGHSGLNQNKITSHIDETENIELSDKIFNLISNKKTLTRKYPTRKAIDKTLCSSFHCRLFTSWFYLENGDKKLPDWVMTMPTDLQLEVIRGLCMGDGHLMSRRGSETTVYVTTSRFLSDQLKTLLMRCRLHFNYNTKQKKGNRKLQYRFEISGNIKNGEFDRALATHNTKNMYYNNYYLMSIKDIVKIDNNDEYVYNIEVDDDNSYVTRICTIHNCEGFGIPLVEAAACGTPICAINYSAMESILKNIKGIPINPLHMFLESELGAERAWPDNNDFAEKVNKFLNKTEREREEIGKKTHLNCRKRYSYNDTARIWESLIDKTEVDFDIWESPPSIKQINLNIPQGLGNEQFVRWCVLNIWGDPQQIDSYIEMRMIRDLNYGVAYAGTGDIFYSNDSVISDRKYSKFTRENVVNEMIKLAEHRNYWENRRIGNIIEETPNFILEAHK